MVHGIDATPVVVLNASAAPAILEYALQSDVDAIAIATHGRGGLAGPRSEASPTRSCARTDLPVLSFRPQATRSGSAHAAV